MKSLTVLISLIIFTGNLLGEELYREWTTIKGLKAVAKLISVENDTAILLFKGKKEPDKIPLSRLSEPDQQYIKKAKASLKKNDAKGKMIRGFQITLTILGQD